MMTDCGRLTVAVLTHTALELCELPPLSALKHSTFADIPFYSTVFSYFISFRTVSDCGAPDIIFMIVPATVGFASPVNQNQVRVSVKATF